MQRKIVFSLLWILSILSTGLFSNASGSDFASLSVEDVLDGIRIRAELLKSVHVTFQFEVYADHNVDQDQLFQGLPLVRYREVDMKRLGEKMRVEAKMYNLQDKQIDRVELFAWDSKKATGYARWPQDLDAKLSGSVKSAKRGPFKTSYWLTPLEQEVFDIRRPLSEILDEAQWTLSNPEEIGHYSAYRLEGTGLWDDKANLQVWIDPTKDFAPVQLILTIKFEDGVNIVEKMSDVRLEQKDGVWVIADAVHTFENPRQKDPNKRKFATKFSIKDYHVGIQFPDETFQIKFPKGTWVYDEIIKIGYIAGEGLWVTEKDGLTHFVQADSLDNIDISIHEGMPFSSNSTDTKLSTKTLSAPNVPQVQENLVPTQPLPVESAKNISTPNRWLIVVTILTVGCMSIVGVYLILAQRKRHEANN